MFYGSMRRFMSCCPKLHNKNGKFMTLDAKIISRSSAEALIPTEISSEIIKEVPKSSAALSLFKQLPNMSAKQKTLPVASTLPSAYFLNGDTDTKKTTNAEWDKLTLTAEEIAVIVPIPEAVLDDSSYSLWDEIKPQIVEAFGLAIDEAVFFGTNKPSTYPDAIVSTAIAKNATVEAGTNEDIAGDIIGEGGVMELVEKSGFRVTGFYADRTLEAKFRNLRDKNNQLLYTPGLTSETPVSLVGRPLVYDEIGGVFEEGHEVGSAPEGCPRVQLGADVGAHMCLLVERVGGSSTKRQLEGRPLLVGCQAFGRREADGLPVYVAVIGVEGDKATDSQLWRDVVGPFKVHTPSADFVGKISRYRCVHLPVNRGMYFSLRCFLGMQVHSCQHAGHDGRCLQG